MLFNYLIAIYEQDGGQPAHFEKQSKFCKICMCDIRMGLLMLKEALSNLKDEEIIED